MELPEDVALDVLKGLGRYIDQAPPSELPANVRRFKGFRPRGLAQHRTTVLAMLESEPTRALVAQWLNEDKPSLSADVERSLRLVTERPEGWDVGLEKRSRSSAEEASDADGQTDALAKAVQREKGKAARARADLKQVRDESQRTLAEERAARAKLDQTRAALEAELATALERAETAEGELARERVRSERELMRARRDAERAIERVAELEGKLKAQGTSERKPVESAPPKPRSARKKSAPKPRTGPRIPLKVPKGFLADDPLVLRAWLERDDVHLIVDGYNVTKAPSGFGDLSLESQRDRLVDALNALAARTKIGVTVVFDGASVVRPRGKRKAVRSVFTAEGEIADDRIVALVDEFPPVPIVVATNDRELQRRVTERGATVATSDQLLALLR